MLDLQRLQHFMDLRDVNQSDLSRSIGRAPNFLGRILSNKRSADRLELKDALAIARVLQVPLDAICPQPATTLWESYKVQLIPPLLPARIKLTVRKFTISYLLSADYWTDPFIRRTHQAFEPLPDESYNKLLESEYWDLAFNNRQHELEIVISPFTYLQYSAKSVTDAIIERLDDKVIVGFADNFSVMTDALDFFAPSGSQWARVTVSDDLYCEFRYENYSWISYNPRVVQGIRNTIHRHASEVVSYSFLDPDRIKKSQTDAKHLLYSL